jgi:hydroxybutyrate-dimer hydrolase
MKTNRSAARVRLLLCTPLVIAACGGGGTGDAAGTREQATHASSGAGALSDDVIVRSYDGVTDDLLTAGLGATGLAGPPPVPADPANPTPAELRQRAIHTNYRSILDISAAGGYGTLYGPNVLPDGTVTAGDGKIAGKEFITYADDGSGEKNVVLMVQVPASFDAKKPCIVAAPSSGSRGVYGAIGSAGEWGLKRGCAVAYTDAGKGIGYHDLMTDRVNLIDGRLVERAAAGNDAHFAADLTGADLAAYNAAFPHRIAYKHVHSQENPEADWGLNVLQSIRFAFRVLNAEYAGHGKRSGHQRHVFEPRNTIVIASSVSNGGGASLRAAEMDREGLIDGVAVAEPNVQPRSMKHVTVKFDGERVPVAGRPLIDYFTFRMVYELCASISENARAANGLRPGWLGFGTAPLGNALTQVGGQELQTIAANRCASLAEKGLASGATTAERANDALARMRAYGWTDPNQDALHASHYRLADIYVTYGYVSAYGRFSVADNVCGFSLANVDALGNVAPQAPTNTLLFGTSNGLNTGADVIYNDSVGGAKLYHLGVSPSTGRMDGALDGMLCLRSMVTGRDPVTGQALTGAARADSNRVRQGIREVLFDGDLHRKPTVIVAGRSDTLLPVNHTARAYVAFNSKIERHRREVRYYEVTNAQHFDAFNPAVGGVLGYDTLFVPLHHYFNQAMNLMWDRLTKHAALPPSQVVRTTPRGGIPGAAPPITAANVPDIEDVPASGDRIKAKRGTIRVPD